MTELLLARSMDGDELTKLRVTLFNCSISKVEEGDKNAQNFSRKTHDEPKTEGFE